MWRKQSGMGIVEMLVGVFIGSLVMLTVYETFAFLEANKRTSVSSNNALGNLMAGMRELETEVKNAGLGLSATGINTCTELNAFYNGSVISNAAPIAPVMITHNSNMPDSISIFFGDVIMGGAPSQILTDMDTPNGTISVSKSMPISTGQGALLVSTDPNAACTLVNVTNIDDTGTVKILDHQAGLSLFNPPDPAASYNKPVAYPSGSAILQVGQLTWHRWRISNNRFETLDNVNGTTTEIADNIVHMRAQYGVTNGSNNDITDWVEATGEWANLDSAHIMRIRAIRVALIAQNPVRVKPTSGSSCDATSTAPLPWPGANPLDMSGIPDWQCYRYRVMSTIIPLKNLVWSIT